MAYLPWLFFSTHRSVPSRWSPPEMPTRRFFAVVVAASQDWLAENCVTVSDLPHTNIDDFVAADLATAAVPSCARGNTTCTFGLFPMLPAARPPWLCPLIPRRVVSTDVPRKSNPLVFAFIAAR